MTQDDSARTTTVQVTQALTAPPRRVFDAWLQPALAAQWLFATPAGENVRTEIDGRVGCCFTVVDRRNGQDVEHHGDDLQGEPPQRLAFTSAVPRGPTRRRLHADLAARRCAGRRRHPRQTRLGHDAAPAGRCACRGLTWPLCAGGDRSQRTPGTPGTPIAASFRPLPAIQRH